MSLYTDSIIAIGDLQGCFESLEGLLDQLPKDNPIVFLGDIVNRGPDSLKTLRHVKTLCESGRAQMVLGNHDMHLLALVANNKKPNRKDTLTDILSAPDLDNLIDWLRHQPLLIDTKETVFVHAGIPPTLSLEKAKGLASEVQKNLRSAQWKECLHDMYGADQFSDTLTGSSRMRAILNGFTRMRFINATGQLDFSLKEGIARMPEGFSPWFELPRAVQKTICFGHWSMLGLVLRPSTIAVDTGCLWGGALSAVRICDRKLFQEPCPQWSAPGC